jgi:hypothetical protein
MRKWDTEEKVDLTGGLGLVGVRRMLWIFWS